MCMMNRMIMVVWSMRTSFASTWSHLEFLQANYTNIVFFNLLFIFLAFGPKVINFVDKAFMLFPISLHVSSWLFFEIVQLFFRDILPYSTDLLHYIKGGNVWVILHHFGSRLNSNFSNYWPIDKSKHLRL